MIYVTFYEPAGAFAGTFNSFAAWFTGGKYCHCEMVLHIEPEELMTGVKRVYAANTDNLKLIHAIETTFFDSKRAKTLLQNSERVWISFSSLWGEELSMRFLEEMEEDSWFAVPGEQTPYIKMVQIPTQDDDQMRSVLEFCLLEMGKDYNKAGALFSWMPKFSASQDVRQKPQVFCSELCTAALKQMGMFTEVNPESVTPNSLYTLLLTI